MCIVAMRVVCSDGGAVVTAPVGRISFGLSKTAQDNREHPKRSKLHPAVIGGIALAACLLPSLAFATSTGTAMPWDSPLTTISQSISGPVAYVIVILGIVVGGGTLIFGGDLNGFARSVLLIVAFGAFILGATSIITTLFPNATSATVGARSAAHAPAPPRKVRQFKFAAHT
ncbi:MAG: TrbC/VirB2 family protein [Caulobacteraceae bacterium]